MRYTGAVDPLTEAVRRKVAAINPNLPFIGPTRSSSRRADRCCGSDCWRSCRCSLGATAMLLVCVGLYGLMSFSVARRSKEIGVRMALGARRSDVRWMIVRESLRPIGVGIIIGVPSAIIVIGLARSFLFGLTTSDPLTLFTAVVVWWLWHSRPLTFRREGLLTSIQWSPCESNELQHQRPHSTCPRPARTPDMPVERADGAVLVSASQLSSRSSTRQARRSGTGRR